MFLFDTSYLIRGKSFKFSDYITIHNPTVGEVLEFGEAKYDSLISRITSVPWDKKTRLWFYENGMDFENINAFDYFCMQVSSLTVDESRIIFGDLNFLELELLKDSSNETYLRQGDILIDNLSYEVISDFIRKINYISLPEKPKYGSEHAKKYRLGIELDKLKSDIRNSKNINKSESSLLLSISGLVNSPGGNYTYGNVMDLKISQFHDAVLRKQRIKHSDEFLTDYYAGIACASAYGGKSIMEDKNQEEIDWLGSLFVRQKLVGNIT